MDKWVKTTLGAIADFKNGKGLKNTFYCRDGDYLVWGANGVIARTNEILNEVSIVVVGRVGAYCGSVHAAFGPNWVTDNAIAATPKNGNDFRFLYYLMKSLQIDRSAIGSAQPLVTQSGLKVLPCCCPPLPEQRAIAHILGSLDDKIVLNRRINETLEAMARAIFKSWFVDFDPVRAKAEGRDTGLPKEIADLFPDSFEDLELGEIPKEWEVRSLDEIAEYLNGLACQKYPPEDDDSLPVIKIRELRQGITENTDRATSNVPSQYIVRDGDILFSWSGSLLVKIWCNGKGVLNQHVFKVSSSQFPKWFYYFWTIKHLEEFQRIAADKATTMGHIKRHHLTDAKVLVPPGNLLSAMNRCLTPFIEKQIINDIEVRTLTQTRDTLLPKLISGEFRVSYDEKFLEGNN